MAQKEFYIVRVGDHQVHTAATLSEAKAFAAQPLSIARVTRTWDDSTDDAEAMNMEVEVTELGAPQAAVKGKR